MSNLPPSPDLSALTQTIRFFKDPFTLTSQCRRELGDLFSLRLLGMGTWVFATEPGHIKEMFKAPPDVLVSGEINAAMLGFMLGKEATFSMDGDAHMKRRKLMLPFFNGKAMLDKIELIRAVTDAELAKLPHGKPFRFGPFAMRISLAVVMHMLFGASTPREIEELTEVFERYAEDGLRSPLLMLPFLQVNLGSWSPWGRILGLRRRAFDAFSQAIADRRADPERFGRNDVASLLCGWRDENGELLSDESIRDEVFNNLFAGHETTAKVLSWSLVCALTHPEVLVKLREELDTVLGDQPIRADNLKSLPYTMAFLEETRRCQPLAPFAGVRRAKQPFQLGDFLIPPGTNIVQGISVLAEREEIFENPQDFVPERFLAGTKPYTWNPFGGGRRMCLGKGLAEVELAVFLTTLLTRFDIELAQPNVERERAGFFFAPSGGLQLKLEPRRR
jgi:cytochrome P450